MARALPCAFLLVAVCACGPLAIGLGANEAFRSDDPDLGEPQIEIETLDEEGREQDPPEFARAIRFIFLTNKPGISLSALVVGPVPIGVNEQEKLCIERQQRLIENTFEDTGALPAADALRLTCKGQFDPAEPGIDEKLANLVPTAFFVGLGTNFSGNAGFNTYVGELEDGTYTLHLRGIDDRGRTDFESHSWVHDRTRPDAPVLAEVDTAGARALRVVWNPSADRPSGFPTQVSGLAGYLIHFDLDDGAVPGTRSAANFSGVAFVSALEGGTGNSPVLAEGDITTFTLQGLFACRQHFVAVSAVDRAGNESPRSAERVRRTLSGGDGTFVSAVRYDGGPGATSVKAADFDRDGILDLVVANRGQGTVSILRGNGVDRRGDGTFRAASSQPDVPLIASLRALDVADFDGDQRPDVVAVGDVVRLLLGSADGSLLPGPGLSDQGGRVASTVHVGRFEASASDPLVVIRDDGVPDFLLAFEGGGASLVNVSRDLGGDLGLAEAAWPADTGSPAVSAGPCFATADFNGDALLDVASCGDLTVQILLDTPGRATVRILDVAYSVPFRAAVPYPSGDDPVSIVAGDFDRDAITDLVVANRDGTVSTLLGNGANGRGDGTFDLPIVRSVGDRPGLLVSGDFDGNGLPDVALAGAVGDSVTLLLGDGTGRFKVGLSYPLSGTPDSLTTGDFNADGVTDLAVTVWDPVEGSGVDVLIGRGASGRADGGLELFRTISGAAASVATGDFNGDRIPDLARSTRADAFPGVADVFLGNGDGTFDFHVRVTGGDVLGPGDFNNDAIVDLLAPARLLGFGPQHYVELTLLSGRGADGRGTGNFDAEHPAVLQGIGDSFDENRSVECGVLLGQLRVPLAVAIEDFDADGVLDFAGLFHLDSFGSGASGVFLHLGEGESGRGEGTFVASGEFDQCGGDSVVAGRFTPDHLPDVVLTLDGKVFLRAAERDATGEVRLGAPVEVCDECGATAVVTADFDDDGVLDVAVANTAGVRVLHGTADPAGRPLGGFGSPVLVALPGSPSQLAVGDFNHDRVPDLVALLEGHVCVLLATAGGDLELSSTVEVPGATSLSGVAIADFNLDGILDVGTGGDALRVFLGTGTVNGE